MQLKITHTGAGIEDGKFRCFYKFQFANQDERKDFVAKLQHQPESWDSVIAWVVDPTSNYAEAYLEVPQDQKNTLISELNGFLEEDKPQESLVAKIWKTIKKPYWWWKTRKL